MGGKQPAIQFYPGDWKKDLGVQSLTLEEKGAWFELLLFMWDAPERGKLAINGIPLTDLEVARMLGVEEAKAKQILKKLVANGVASLEANCLVCRRMLREWKLSLLRKEAGRLGGSRTQANLLANDQAKTPASSSSSSSSSSSREEMIKYFIEIGSSKERGESFIDHFESNGWKVSGKTPMKDWRAAARNWVRMGKQFGLEPIISKPRPAPKPKPLEPEVPPTPEEIEEAKKARAELARLLPSIGRSMPSEEKMRPEVRRALDEERAKR